MEYDVAITVNGVAYQARVPANTTLMRLLRDTLFLGGTKEGCGIGECGACSVILDGKLVNACLVLAVEANGSTVSTIEGEARGDQLSDLQQAFIDHHALQCGFCTPGMIMAARELLDRNPSPTEDEIIEALAGNLCRCTGYVTAIAAVQAAAKARSGGGR
jgi:carbon-monoxide dehydrogenase small subunit